MGRGLKQDLHLQQVHESGVAPHGAWIETCQFTLTTFSSNESPRMGRGLKPIYLASFLNSFGVAPHGAWIETTLQEAVNKLTAGVAPHGAWIETWNP